MPPRVQEHGDHRPNRGKGIQYSPEEKIFICNLKLSGKKYPEICHLFTSKFGKVPPNRSTAKRLVVKLNKNFTVLDLRKGRSGCKKTVRTARNIALVRRSLEKAASRSPGQLTKNIL